MISRTASRADIPAACLLLNDIISFGGSTAFQKTFNEPEFSSAFITGERCITCYVCEDSSGNVLGFQALSRNSKLQPNWADIATFARLTPKVKGVGSLLFHATLEHIEESDIHCINATIRADNQSGLSYYTKMGFIDYQIEEAVPLMDGTPVDRISKRYDV